MKRGGTSLRERLGLVSLTPGWSWFLLSVALGAISVLGFAPFYLYPVPIATLAALAWLWRRTHSVRRSVSIGFGFGLGCFCVGTSWVYVSMHDFGGMAWPVAGFATMVFCSVFALFPAAAGWYCASGCGGGYQRSGANKSISREYRPLAELESLHLW
jgi:apolipoprotein N-acyltransferase